MTRIEESLRTMLAAEAEQLKEEGLRPYAPFPAVRQRRAHRGWTVTAVVGAAATTAGILVGAHLVTVPGGQSPATAQTIAAGDPSTSLSITFSSRTITLSDPAATVVTPVPHVRAADPRVARNVSGVIDQALSDARSAFRNRISEPGTASGRSSVPLSQEIKATTAIWRQFLTVRLDDTETGWLTVQDGSGRTFKGHAALVFDTATGARVLPPDLFTDLDQAAASVRDALIADHRPGVTADQLATLSLEPSQAGTTTPLTCYPTDDGLRCAVDDGSLTPDYTGPLETVVPWDTLAPVMQPRLRARFDG